MSGLEESIWLRPGNDVMARLHHLARVRDLDLHELVRVVLRVGLEHVDRGLNRSFGDQTKTVSRTTKGKYK